MVRVFENPANGYKERMSGLSILWTLLFGFIYLAIKGVWTHAVAWLVLVIFGGSFTSGIVSALVWIVYAFFAPTIIANNYLKKGWKEVS